MSQSWADPPNYRPQRGPAHEALAAADRILSHTAALESQVLPDTASVLVWEVGQEIQAVRGYLIGAAALEDSR